MSIRARCTFSGCPEPLEHDVPEFGPLPRCPSCGHELVRLDEIEDYPETRTGPVLDDSSVIPRATVRPSRPGTLPEGTVFADRYEILKKLGQGGMGAVYLAQDTSLERKVALKIPNFRGAEPDFVKRFIREARAMAQLADQANICKIIDVVTPRGEAPYLTMEFVEGKTLAEVLRSQRGALPAAEAARIVAATARALGKVHALGIIHRDLKPDNLMLKEDGTPIIMDFGLARRDSDERITVANEVMGTLPYMSPEQTSGEIDATGMSSDIYGLGVILYELLTGQKPFTGHGYVIINKIRHESPVPPSELRPGLDPWLEAICLKAMAKLPADRQESMEALALDLESLLTAGESPTEIQILEPPPEPPKAAEASTRADGPPTEPEPSTKIPPTSEPEPDLPSRRRPIWVPVGVGAVVVAVAVWWLIPRSRAPGPVDGGTSTPPTNPVVTQAGPVVTPDGPVVTPAEPSTSTIVPPTSPAVPEVERRRDPIPRETPATTELAPPRMGARADGRRLIPSESTGMILQLITPDRFVMGSTLGAMDERPPHEVRIGRPFYLGKFEVTQAEYRLVTGRSPSHFTGDDRRPVETISWLEAVLFCNLLSVKDHLPMFYRVQDDEVSVPDWSAPGYRLPTEAEWEYACRAGRPGEFGPGDDPADLADVAWFGVTSWVGGFLKTHSEIRKPGRPHKFDLENMQGNVAEWCWDWYDETYPAGPLEDPTGPPGGTRRVIRGGCYADEAARLRPFARENKAPTWTAGRIGFRVARNGS